MASKWEYFPEEYLYRKNGRVFSEDSILRNLSLYTQEKTSSVQFLALRLRDGDINLQQWTNQMRSTIKRTHIINYIIARGGNRRMTQQDWGRLGGVIYNQYRYLDRFATDISGGNLTLGQIQARSALYINAARQSYERGRTQGARGISLPAYPGDGTSECFSNCRCRWQIEETDTEFLCSWKLGEAEHCDTCVQRATLWSPLMIAKV